MINLIRFAILISVISTQALAKNDPQKIPNRKLRNSDGIVFDTSGFVNFSASSTNQSSAFEGKKLPDNLTTNHSHNNQIIGNDSQAYLKAGIKTKDDSTYGAAAKFEFLIDSNRRKVNPNLDQAFFYAEKGYGEFQIGNNKAVNQKMKVGPARFARGAGGINGKYLEHINLPMLTDSSASSQSVCNGGVGSLACSNVKLPSFILLAQSPIGHGGDAKSFYNKSTNNSYIAGDQAYGAYNQNRLRAIKDDSFDGMEDATKLNYYSPRIEGFQLGLSYTPNSSQDGITEQTVRDIPEVRFKNIFSVGANYVTNIENVGFAVSATAEKGNIDNSKTEFGYEKSDLFSYDFGLTMTYFGFSFGTSYGVWQDYGESKNGIYSCDYNSSIPLSSQDCSNRKKFKDPYYHTAGIAYKFGPIGASLTGIKSEFQRNDYEAISFGFDYKFTKDLMPYFEVTKFSLKSNQVRASNVTNQNSINSNQRQVRDNQGYVLLTGILYSF